MKPVSYSQYTEGALTVLVADWGDLKVEWAVKGTVSMGEAVVIRTALLKQLTEMLEISHA